MEAVSLPIEGSTSGGDIPDTHNNAHKRKYQDLMALDIPASSSPLQHPPSSPAHTDRSESSTPAPTSFTEAQKVYIARTAPHLLGRNPTPSSSRTPSAPPSGRSSPTSDDGRATPDAGTSTPTRTNDSHHTLPEGYRGPALRKNDAEDFAPLPSLVPAVGSATLYNTLHFAVNRNGWRYTAAGPSSQHLPLTLFKTLETRPANVHWCWSDRSQFMHISANADIISTDKGFRSARTNIGVRQGEWYAEIQILPPETLTPGVGSPGPLPAPMRDGPHIRLGWGRREAPLNAPVGFDAYSYGFRDKTGDKVTLSRPLPYGKPFKAGDVVGMYIKLPPLPPPTDQNDPANIKRERIPIRYRGQLYFESLEYPRTREMEQLMERSRKGNSIEEALKGIEGTGVFEPHDPSQDFNLNGDHANGSNGAATVNASSGGGGGGGSAKVKNRKTPASKEKPSGPTIASLRPIPKLAGSKIGFFVNGEPQGIAFRDLFDFRPLRVKGFTNLKPNPNKTTTSRPGKQTAAAAVKGKAETGEPVINVKARENVFDDGALGYFAFVSSYGGARARLITGEEGFMFPPPVDIEAALEAAGLSSPPASGPGETRWKPLSARFEEHLAEMWEYDLADEAKAQEKATKEAEDKAKKNAAAKERYAAAKRKHAAALARNATASPRFGTPVDGEPDVEADVHAAVAKMEEDIEHPEENEAEAEADTTITRMEEDQDPVAEEQRGAVEGWDMSGVVTPALRSSPGPTKTPPLPEMEERSQGMLETEAAERALQGDIEMHDQT